MVSVIIILVLVRGAFLAKNFETINGWNVRQWPVLGIQVRIGLEQDVWKTEAEVRTVDVQVLLPWHVYFLTFGAVCL